MGFSDLWGTVTGYFGGDPGDTGPRTEDLFTAQAEPNWAEINRVLEMKGRATEVAETVARAEARVMPPNLLFTVTGSSSVAEITEKAKAAVGSYAGFFQTTLSKILIGLVVVVVGLLALNMLVARTSR